ncbi:hypothetical protein [Gordonia sp. MMO-8]|uniref:hypothetical protein n=1 Tax=Gordonia sp. MMO-8 TaxID=3127886 RepID=UPI003015DE0B
MTLTQPPRHAIIDDDEQDEIHTAALESDDEPANGPVPSRRTATRVLAPVIACAAVLLTGVVAGGFVFLNTAPAVRPPAVNLSPDDVESAQESVSSAKMMIDMLSTAVSSGTAGIDKVVSSIEPTFASINTAASAADQMAAGLAAAPDLQAAAARITELGSSVSSGLGEAQKLAASAKDVDDLVTPIIDGLSRSDVPGADKTISQLKSLQVASRDIASSLGDLGGLRGELDRTTAAAGPAAREIDGALAQARTAATELKDGLTRLASAKGDTEKAADSLSSGITQLKGALSLVSNNLSSADESLMSDESQQPAYVFDHANRIGRGIVTGASTALGLLLVGVVTWVVVRRRRRTA